MSPRTKPAGEKRDCSCLRATHAHGTLGGYATDGCRCLDCRAAAAAEWRRRYRLKTYGQWQSKYVDPCGVRRRVQALMTLGWDISTVADRAGLQRSQLIAALSRRREVFRTTHEAVAAVYDDLWNQPRVGTCRSENIAVAMTLKRAERAGYAPPLAWDDDEIDDPQAAPHTPTETPWEHRPCGTRAAARRHRRRSEPLDAACRAAETRKEDAA